MDAKYPLRINKYLSSQDYCSRREADGLIKAGLVKINGRVAILGDKVSETDKIEVSPSVKSRLTTLKYYAYHKPASVVTHISEDGQTDIKEIFPLKDKTIFPVGRLDKSSRGLIILTNDGRITGKLLGPEMNREKEYAVRVDKKISGFFLNKMSYGLNLGDFITKPCQAKQTGFDEFNIILTEGKKHQIRRMCDALGFVVKDLQRIRIMNIGLKDLKPNEYREIKGKELEIFLSELGLK
ncbi:MAG: pseudouridine synthase [Patescibacteria group bacterium]